MQDSDPGFISPNDFLGDGYGNAEGFSFANYLKQLYPFIEINGQQQPPPQKPLIKQQRPKKPEKPKKQVHPDGKFIDVIIRGIKCTIIKPKFNVLETLYEALQIRPNLNLSKASAYLKLVNESNQEITGGLVDRVIFTSTNDKSPQSNLISECKLFLQNIYPNIQMKFIESELEKHKFKLIETIKHIDTFPNPPKENKPRATQNNLKFEDIIVSAQLEEFVSEDYKKQLNDFQKEEEEWDIAEAVADNSMYECECCFCECPMERLVQCPDGHLFCFKCVRTQIETAISEGRSDVPCLHYGGCDQKIPIKELERSMPEDVLQRLFQTETQNALISADIKGMVKCHKCGYMAIIENEEYMDCPQCHSKTCTKCQNEYHQGMTCEQFRNLDKNRLLEEKMNEAVIRVCPKCKTQFIKEQGCNKMECPRCKSLICYWCRKIIPKEVGYNHFFRGDAAQCPPGQCPLWVQNNELHEIEAQQARNGK
ncbi:IBR domain containing protein [Histomonas meleagridis]|uniref:IBR domain containing protein n=1 Tax=Histomonas meleagridis TaxID=135588 RepID=UPI00355A0C89|nr:IBR domain containing protein [Histomonas meleagridis]KAH0804803.1 IBR domain containing protein [Histomonas meleagridis]